MLTRDQARGAPSPVRGRRLVAVVLWCLLPLLWTGSAAAGVQRMAAATWTAASVPSARTHPALEDGVRALQTQGSKAAQAARLAGKAAPDSLFAAVLMCDFADSLFYGRYGQLPGDYPPPAQSDFYYLAHDSTFYHHQMMDVQAYFDAASGGRFTFAFEVVAEVANLPHPMGWYGDHPDEGEQKVLMARDAMALLDDAVDFSRFDTVVLIHAGAGEETDILGDSPEQIYSSYLGPEAFIEARDEEIIPDPWLPTDDVDAGGAAVVVDQVLILPENEFQDAVEGYSGYYGSLGVYCFEVGLRLGMLSLSDFTPAGAPDSQGIGEFGLMGYGLFVGAGYIPSHPCAFNKMLMGWLEPYDVDPDTDGVYRLFPAESAATDSTLARVEIGPSEYWLLEYRMQDPDGNGIFSFPGDLNGDNVPNYFDADSDSLDGTPTSWYDPATDEREWLFDGEFDFFMSENDARTDNVKGAGSGLYVWHVDEGVIRAALLSEQNVFNADPDRKSVDLEEADGIQDLDQRLPSAWVLGADDDSFRGEDSAVFGPGTLPSTETAGGIPTGIVIDEISHVVADSAHVDPGSGDIVILYAESMTFRCRRTDVTGAGDPVPVADRRLQDVDLSGSHLLAADLDASGDGALEIVATADSGRVYAFTHDLEGFLEGPPQPGFFAVGKGPGGAAVDWNGPAAVGDLDDDGLPEVLLTAESGLYAFNGEDGTEMVDGDGDPLSHGLALPLTGCNQPPVVVDDGVLLVSQSGSGLRVHEWNLSETHTDELAGTGLRATAPPFSWHTNTWLPVLDETDGDAYLAAVETGVLWPTALAASGGPALVGEDVLVIPAADGRALSMAGGAAPMQDYEFDVWPEQAALASPLSPGLAYATDGGFVLSGADGFPATGWPVQPRIPARAVAGSAAPSPLAVEIGGSERHLFASRDGRLFLYDRDGRLEPGWPLAGPGETAGTPLLMDLDGSPGLELAAAGAMSRVTGYDEAGAPEGDAVSVLSVWSLPGTAGAGEIWPMWGGSARRAASAGATLPQPVGDALLREESHICYPAPLIGDDLHVRATANRDCLVRAYLYNLEGEEVRASQAVQAHGGPVEILLDVASAVSGVYICRLVAEDGASRETSVRPVVIAR